MGLLNSGFILATINYSLMLGVKEWEVVYLTCMGLQGIDVARGPALH